jgi:hypothetical protein
MPSSFVWSCRNIATRHNLSQDGVRLALTVLLRESETAANPPRIPRQANIWTVHRNDGFLSGPLHPGEFHAGFLDVHYRADLLASFFKVCVQDIAQTRFIINEQGCLNCLRNISVFADGVSRRRNSNILALCDEAKVMCVAGTRRRRHHLRCLHCSLKSYGHLFFTA